MFQDAVHMHVRSLVHADQREHHTDTMPGIWHCSRAGEPQRPPTLRLAATGENSYSHHTDMDVGVAIIDRFTFFALEFFEAVHRGSNATMADFLAFMGCECGLRGGEQDLSRPNLNRQHNSSASRNPMSCPAIAPK